MATTFNKIDMYRERAKDTSLPQEVRNQYLDKAAELEYKAYEETKAGKTTTNAPEKKKLAKGGAVVAKTPMKALKKPAALVIAVGVGKPKGKVMLAKGGMAKKGKC